MPCVSTFFAPNWQTHYQNEKHLSSLLAGLYVHIPFCRKACHYCNFHFSTSLKLKNEVLQSLQRELELQRNYLNGATLETIYIGGGTPSVLSASELNQLFDKIRSIHDIAPDAEITLEANPDDLSAEYLHKLRNETPVNRLSIGIQSFAEHDLRWMNRAHNAIDAKACIEYAQDAGFDNLTIDLIYGSPTTSDEQFLKNLATVFDYDIPHVSCYALTVEEGTALSTLIAKKKTIPVDDEHAANQFEILMEAMQRQGYVHYEISNFAQPDHYAKHNSNYWLGVPYLGIGPSAHSFDGMNRQWNVANNPQYVRSLANYEVPFTHEELSDVQRYNEYVMTSIRTIWGCDPALIGKRFGKKILSFFNKKILQFIHTELVMTDGKKYFLTDSGKLLADRITMELFFE